MNEAQELADSSMSDDELMERARHLLDAARKRQDLFMHRSMHSVRWEKMAGVYSQALMIRKLGHLIK